MLSPEEISIKIAVKARDEWIKKAAAYHVAAQEAQRTGLIPIGRNRAHRLEGGELAEHVATLNKSADEAEQMAREWDAKTETNRARNCRTLGSNFAFCDFPSCDCEKDDLGLPICRRKEDYS